MMLEFHPLADIFPLLEGTELDELVADIREHGLHEPVVIHESRILDGRNRYRACMAAGVEPTFTAYQGDDPVGYVISLNLRRRHLDESQRAMVAAKLATLKLGDNQHSEGLPIGRSSDLLNVGERSVARAREVQEHGAPELVRAVERGEVSVSAAADVATLPKAEQQEIVARGKREILEAAKAIRGEEARKRYEARIARNLEISARNSPMEKGQRYPVILADPPWDYRLYNEESGSSRAAAEHYPTMKLGEICELPVSDLATEAAVLFLDYWPMSQRSVRRAARLGLSIQVATCVDQGQDRSGPFCSRQARAAACCDQGRYALPTTSQSARFCDCGPPPRAQPQARGQLRHHRTHVSRPPQDRAIRPPCTARMGCMG
jgi:hypothetical protein